MKILLGKVLFGAIFIVALPAMLIVWAKSVDGIIQIPIPNFPIIAAIAVAVGFLLILGGMLNLWFIGKGLPMNAFPPARFVTEGLYRYIKHPIYVGAVLVSFSLSMFYKSSSGFWLISPMLILAIIAYVIGFENELTQKIAGYKPFKPTFSIPEPIVISSRPIDILNVFLLVFLPWAIIYELVIIAGVPKDAIYSNLPFEAKMPVIEFTEVFYLFTYLFVVCIPFILKTKLQFNKFMNDALWAMLIGFSMYLFFPFIVAQRAFLPETILGKLILFERTMDAEAAALPAFHAIWAFLAARYFSIRFPKGKMLWWTIGVLIALSCITTGNHSISDVVAGYVVFIMALKRNWVWDNIRKIAEKIANSWHEWHFGPIRLINHGIYAGATGLFGFFIIGSFLGSSYALAGFFTGVIGIVGAALWAQLIEGSPRLLRPYGYYGSVVGALLGCGIMQIVFKVDFFLLLAAFAIAGPWIQIIGRLRCLVQGCCHGKPSSHEIGIRFTHPKSRVLKIANLKGMHIHPTQLYSIFSNFFIGMLLFRLVSLEMNAPFIIGIYFMLNGLARFIEESFRGEPQTPYWAGMRIYQWIALISILAGAIFTTVPHPLVLAFQFNIPTLWLSIVSAVFATIAYGMDFPQSNMRFARLTS